MTVDYCMGIQQMCFDISMQAELKIKKIGYTLLAYCVEYVKMYVFVDV